MQGKHYSYVLQIVFFFFFKEMCHMMDQASCMALSYYPSLENLDVSARDRLFFQGEKNQSYLNQPKSKKSSLKGYEDTLENPKT